MTLLGNLLFGLIIPAALFIASMLFAAKPELLPAALVPLLVWLPYILAVVGGLLAWHFKRSRSVFFVLTIAAVYWLLCDYLPAADTQGNADGMLAYGLLLLLVPLNVFIFSVVEDRGVLTGWGIMQLCFLLIQALGVSFLMFDGAGFIPELKAQWMSYYATTIVFYDFIPLAKDVLAPFTQPAVLVLLLVGGWLLFRFKQTGDSMQSGLFSALCCLAGGLYAIEPQPVAIFFSAAVFVVTLTLFQESYSMAFIDELTELPSRRALTADFKKLGRKYVIAMADVDHFKKFNDTYGHDVGDDVLRMVAGQLSRVTGGGTAYRYGGEEFIILFPRSTAKDVEEHLNIVRSNIEHARFRIRGALPKGLKVKKGQDPAIAQVTISIGAAERVEKSATPETVIKAADQALYKAKKAGRNCVRIAK